MSEEEQQLPPQEDEVDSEGRIINHAKCEVCGKEFSGYGIKSQSARYRATIHTRFTHGTTAPAPKPPGTHVFFRTNRYVTFGINGKMSTGYEHTVPAGQFPDLERDLKARFGTDIIVDVYDKA